MTREPKNVKVEVIEHLKSSRVNFEQELQFFVKLSVRIRENRQNLKKPKHQKMARVRVTAV